MNRPICKHCFYAGSLSQRAIICDYLLIAGHRRPCEASDNCAAFHPRTKADVKWAKTREEQPERPKRGIMAQYHDKALEMYNAGMFDVDIARKLNVGAATVGKWRHDNGLPMHKRPAAMDGKEEQAMTLYQNGANDRIIAEALGVTIYAVRSWRGKNKLEGTYGRNGG